MKAVNRGYINITNKCMHNMIEILRFILNFIFILS